MDRAGRNTSPSKFRSSQVWRLVCSFFISFLCRVQKEKHRKGSEGSTQNDRFANVSWSLIHRLHGDAHIVYLFSRESRDWSRYKVDPLVAEKFMRIN